MQNRRKRMEPQCKEVRKQTSKQQEMKSRYLVIGSVQKYVVLELSVVGNDDLK